MHVDVTDCAKSEKIEDHEGSKFYLRMNVTWPLCLRHNILRHKQNDDCMTLGKLINDIPSRIYLFILSLHFVPSLQSAVCILYPACRLQSAFCTDRFMHTLCAS